MRPRRLLLVLLVAGGALLTALAAWTALASGRGAGNLLVPGDDRGRAEPAPSQGSEPATRSTAQRSALPAGQPPQIPEAQIPESHVPSGPPTRGSDGRYSHARFQVVDQVGGAPLAQVAVLRGTSGTLLGLTSETGRLVLRDCQLGELVFVHDGHLITGLEAHGDAWGAADAAVARGDEVRVVMLDDQFTVGMRLRFARADGRPMPDVRFTVQQLADPPVSSLAVPRVHIAVGAAIPPEFTRAWITHVRYTRLQQFTRACHHYGLESEHEVFVAPEGVAEVRLIALGSWRVTALGKGGARGTMDVPVESLTGAEATVSMAPGSVLRGRVLAADDQAPVAGALVSVTPAGFLLAPATADAQGRFVLEGLPPGQVLLDVRADGFEARVVGPLTATGDEQTLLLVRRKSLRLFGKVLERGTDRAISGAVVSLDGGQCRTDAAGAFAIDVPLQSAITLEIGAPGYEAYAEQLDSESGTMPGQFHLLPADVELLLRARIVSRLRGVVVDQKQQPVVGALVDLQPMTPLLVAGIPGRAILRGGMPADLRRVQSDAQGAFEIVTPLEGELLLSTYDQGTRIDTPLNLVRGTDRDRVVLRR